MYCFLHRNFQDQATAMQESSHARIIVRDYITEIRIGLHPWEKNGPQRVIVNVELFVKGAGYIIKDNPIVDYDPIYAALKTWPQREHTLYIETYLRELLALSFQDLRVDSCRVSLCKPDIFPEAAAVGVEVYMTRADYLAGEPG
jgi:dihydroneopterin aldolase